MGPYFVHIWSYGWKWDCYWYKKCNPYCFHYNGGLTNEKIVKQVMLLGVDGVSMFQWVKFGLIVLLKTQQAPYLIRIHCMAHETNLVMQSLSSMPMVSKLENLFQSLYGYFSSSLKHHLEFTKLAKIVEIKGLKVLLNVKTRWINMLPLLKKVWERV